MVSEVVNLLSTFNQWASPLVAFALTLLAIPLLRRLGRRAGVTAQLAAASGDVRVPATGGVAIIAGIVVALSLIGNLNWWLGLGAGAMLVVGQVDDAIDLRPGQKLVAQLIIIVCTVLFALPAYTFIGWRAPDLLITVFWLVATTNAFNLIDGLDGLAAGVGISVVAAIATIGVVRGAPELTSSSLAVAGALGAFLIFNLPPASIIMGDAGALPLGFILGVLSLQGGALATNSRVTPWAFSVLVMVVPLIDAGIVTAARLLTGRAVSRKKLDHVHDRLLSLGLTQWRAVSLIWTASVFTGGCAIAANLMSHELVIAALPWFALAAAVLAFFMIDLTFDASSPAEAYDYLPKFARMAISLAYRRRFAEAAMDVVLMTAAYFGACALRLDFKIDHAVLASMLRGLPWVVLLTYPAFLAAGVYRGIWRHAGFTDSLRFAAGSVFAGVLVAIGSHFLPIRHSGSIAVLYALLLVNLLVATRMSFQMLRNLIGRLAMVTERVLVVGAGELGTAAAEFVVNARRSSARVVGFLDGDEFKRGKIVHGEEVLGAPGDIERVHKLVPFTEIVVADDGLASEQFQMVHRFARMHQIPVRRFSMQLNDTQELIQRPIRDIEATGSGVPIKAARPA